MSVLAPSSTAEALAALAMDPDAHLLSGGTDFMVEVNFGHRRPASVISIGQIAELQTWSIDLDRGVVHIGAAVTLTDLMASEIAAHVPALVEAARTVGSPQIRNAATLGGNLGTCSPAGDTLPVLAALGATIELKSLGGTRTLPFHEFMTGPKRSARRPDEIVTAVEVPIVEGWQGFAKVGTRNAMVIAVCNAVVVVDSAARQVYTAMGSVGPTILRATDAESWVAEQIDWDGWMLGASQTGGLTEIHATAREFGRRCAASARPIDDHRSTAEYRGHAVGVLAGRLLQRALS